MCGSWGWCLTPIVPALRMWRQKDSELKASLDYTIPCLKKWEEKTGGKGRLGGGAAGGGEIDR